MVPDSATNSAVDMIYSWKKTKQQIEHYALYLTIAVSLVSISASTAFHFLARESLQEFVAAIVAVICTSSLTRFGTRGIVTRMQENDYEFAAGLFSGVFG